jgi:serine/threonine protein kinase
MDLVNRLLEPNPNSRITLEELKLHPWMHGEIYDDKEMNIAMNLRKKIIQSKII